MSVLIKGIGMPMSCYECRYSDEDENECEINLCKCEWGHNRPDDCPMVEVETPHGRLIDVNELLDDIGLEDNGYNRDVNVGEIITLENIDRITTVIEAEE